jgi:hypothetical protein
MLKLISVTNFWTCGMYVNMYMYVVPTHSGNYGALGQLLIVIPSHTFAIREFLHLWYHNILKHKLHFYHMHFILFLSNVCTHFL